MVLEEDQLLKLKDVLIAGCEKQLLSGKEVIDGIPFDENGGKDPIVSAIDWETVNKLETNLISKLHYGLVQKLGFVISELEMLSFYAGFDGLERLFERGDKGAFALGKELRATYIRDIITTDDEKEEVVILNERESNNGNNDIKPTENSSSDLGEPPSGDEG